MTPYYSDPWLTVWGGDCRAVMAELPSESVHCVVTSPPFWGLRDYGTAGQLGLEPTPEEYELEPVPAVVLDCFAGSGTVGRVANRLSRRAVLIDLNPDYLVQQMKRNRDIPLGLGA